MARPRSTEARQKALAAAGELLVEVGVGGFTVDEVSRRSGVAKTTIYRNWSSTEDLLYDALNRVVEPEPQPDTGSLRGDLLALADHLVSQSDPEHTARRRLFSGMFAASFDDQRLGDLYGRILANRCTPIEAILQRADDRGELSPHLDRDVVVDLLAGPVLFRFILRGETFTRTELEELVDIALHGILGRSDRSDQPDQVDGGEPCRCGHPQRG